MNKVQGVYTALITPFDQQDSLDEDGLRVLIQRQIEANVEGIVVLGTTGEPATLLHQEKQRVIEIAREECNQNTTLVVGTGSYSTRQTIENTILAKELGADAAIIITPYYNKPTQEGLYLHFKTIASATDLPIILYNAPGRTGQNLQPETFKMLLDIPSIISIKEASGSISQISDIIEIAREKRPEFSIMCGDDALTLPLMALGGDGIVSVISNLLPQDIKKLIQSIVSGDFETAREIHFYLAPLIKAMFFETNPIPIKASLTSFNLPAGNCRLPLCPLSPENALKLKIVLQHLNPACCSC